MLKIQLETKTFRRFVLGAHLASSRPVGAGSKVIEKNWRYISLRVYTVIWRGACVVRHKVTSIFKYVNYFGSF